MSPVASSIIASPEPLDLTDPYASYIFPSLVTRIKAVFSDTLLLLLFFAIASSAIDNAGGAPDALRIIMIGLIILYDPLMTAFTGGTIGHRIMKIRVALFDNPGSNISVRRAFLRFFIKWLLGWIALLTVTSNTHKRAMHDIVSGSIVIYNDDHFK